MIVRPRGMEIRRIINKMTIGHGSSISAIKGAREQHAFEKKFWTERASYLRAAGYMFSEVCVANIVAKSDIERPNLVKKIKNGIYL